MSLWSMGFSERHPLWAQGLRRTGGPQVGSRLRYKGTAMLHTATHDTFGHFKALPSQDAPGTEEP